MRLDKEFYSRNRSVPELKNGRSLKHVHTKRQKDSPGKKTSLIKAKRQKKE